MQCPRCPCAPSGADRDRRASLATLVQCFRHRMLVVVSVLSRLCAAEHIQLAFSFAPNAALLPNRRPHQRHSYVYDKPCTQRRKSARRGNECVAGMKRGETLNCHKDTPTTNLSLSPNIYLSIFPSASLSVCLSLSFLYLSIYLSLSIHTLSLYYSCAATFRTHTHTHTHTHLTPD